MSTPDVNKFRVSSSSVNVDGNRSPDAWDLGLACVLMTTMHSAVLSVASNNNPSSQTLLVL